MAGASGKGALLPFTLANGTQMSGSFTSSVSNVQYMSDISYQMTWTGAPTGTFVVQGSVDYKQGSDFTVLSAGTWINLPLSATITATGTGDSARVDIMSCPVPWLRLVYTATGAGVQTIQPVADSSKSLAGKYFLISDEQGNNYAIWFKVSGTGSAPTVAGYTNVEQDITTNDDAATIGAALAITIAALNGAASFGTAGTTTVTVTNLVAGPFTLASAGNSGFTVTATAGQGLLSAYVTAKAA